MKKEKDSTWREKIKEEEMVRAEARYEAEEEIKRRNREKEMIKGVKRVGTKRSIGMVFLLSVLTLGIYQIYWYYITSKAVKEFTKEDYSPGLRTLVLFVPILSLFVLYYLVEDVSRLQEKADIKSPISPILILLLAMFTGGLIYPAVAQDAFNKYLDVKIVSRGCAQFSSKSKKRKSILSVIVVMFFIFPILSSIVLVSMGAARVDARNTARKADMRQVIIAQEMYREINGVYVTALKKTNGTQSIKGYLYELNDPKNEMGREYVWLNNATASVAGCDSGEYFCVYATLEGESTDIWYAASEMGTETVTILPGSVGGIYGTEHCTCF
jgi:type II secretory pathway pseudopilin PulG